MLRPPGRPGPVARSRGASSSRVLSPRPRAPRRSHYHQYPRCVVGASALGLDAPDALIAALKDDADLTAAPLAKALAEQIARGEPSKCIEVLMLQYAAGHGACVFSIRTSDLPPVASPQSSIRL